MRFQEMVDRYQKRQKSSALIDSVFSGLSFADEAGAQMGFPMEKALSVSVNLISLGLPFALIALTEQTRVWRGRKTQTAAFSDMRRRGLKTGASMGAGALATLCGAGAALAIPVSMAARILSEKAEKQFIRRGRIRERSQRLRAMRQKMLYQKTEARESHDNRLELSLLP